MKRHALTKLLEWKDDPHRKPLLIQGARQVGKTWLMKEFGRLNFSKTAYIHFDNNTRMRDVFNVDYNIPRLISAFQIETGVTGVALSVAHQRRRADRSKCNSKVQKLHFRRC